jgi:TPR repeat protein
MHYLIRILILAIGLALPLAASGDHLQDGLDAFNIGEYDKSMENCLPLAEEGIPAAQFCVARLYANGFGVEMNDEQALKWYGLAAEQGHAEAQFNLGVMHANGWGVPINDVEAAKWYRPAAEHGLVEAQMALAAVLHAGRGVEKNIPEAYTWYKVAAELGDTAAISKRDDVAGELSAAEKLAADEQAADWLETLEQSHTHAHKID